MFPDMFIEEGIAYFDFGTIVVCLVSREPVRPYVVDGVQYVEVFATK